MKNVLFVLLLLAAGSLSAADPDACRVRVILFVPADLQVPAGAQQRMEQTITYTEHFFLSGLKHWGHEDVVSPFPRDDAGRAELMVVRGSKPAAQYNDVSLRSEAIAAAKKQYKLGDAKQVWWVFVYKGDPPKKFRGYRGGYGPIVGGWSVCNYDSRPGIIKTDDPLGSDFLTVLTLKGMIHELGHGFRLPHIGPKVSDDAGNSLMGPNHAAYRKIIPKRERRVYLTEASAAMLACHPAFHGQPDRLRQQRQVKLSGEKYSAENGQITITGHVASRELPRYVIVTDRAKSQPGEYWTKHYVGAVKADGNYSVDITEVADGSGTLAAWFYFKDGTRTEHQAGRAVIEKNYRRVRKQIRIQ